MLFIDKATNETIMGIEKMLNESSVSMKHKLIDLEKQLAIESSKNKNLLLEMRANERNLELMNSTLNLKLKGNFFL